jgi:Pyruvate/2-oxoacid:ferredoxin oxidoreductase delta subunit
LSKASFHLKLQDAADFGRMLAALTLCLKPRLYVMDGIVAMEGNGPRSGDPRRMNALLFSTDPVALDSVMCRLAALDPALLPTNPPGMKWGLGTFVEEEIELVGDGLAPLICGDFAVNRAKVKRQIPPGAGFIVNHFVAPRPAIDERLCTRCGTCVQVCPVTPKAVDWRDGTRSRPPRHLYDRCIRCYCCQELCPEKAISVRRGLFGA